MASASDPLSGAAAELDIVIPVYNEGANIVATLRALAQNVRTAHHVLICYDHDGDNTLPAVRASQPALSGIVFVKNEGRGTHAAVMSGFRASTAPYVLAFMADDDFNAPIVDAMVREARDGADIVCASRFLPGGCMVGCPWLKAFLVRAANFCLRALARFPTSDASNGFRLFSRRAITEIPVESRQGFTYSIELTAKAHRLGWKIAEVPAQWFERKDRKSRFQVLKWLPAYLRWFGYVFATSWGGRTAAGGQR